MRFRSESGRNSTARDSYRDAVAAIGCTRHTLTSLSR
jgi:hypothetical protein